jgi:hypothetical protein
MCVFAGDKYDTVLFDVDNKDTCLGMSCPPKEFVTQQVLQSVKAILKKQGKYIVLLQ